MCVCVTVIMSQEGDIIRLTVILRRSILEFNYSWYWSCLTNDMEEVTTKHANVTPPGSLFTLRCHDIMFSWFTGMKCVDEFVRYYGFFAQTSKCTSKIYPNNDVLISLHSHTNDATQCWFMKS